MNHRSECRASQRSASMGLALNAVDSGESNRSVWNFRVPMLGAGNLRPPVPLQAFQQREVYGKSARCQRQRTDVVDCWVCCWVEKQNGPLRPVFTHFLAEPESVFCARRCSPMLPTIGSKAAPVLTLRESLANIGSFRLTSQNARVVGCDVGETKCPRKRRS